MKKIIALSITGFIICSAFNKPTVPLTDYRDAYTGNYFCNSSCESRRTKPNEQTTYTDTLTIGVAKDALDSILKITIQQEIIRLKLKNNILYPYPAGPHMGGKFFAADSISFISSVCKGKQCRYAGKRK